MTEDVRRWLPAPAGRLLLLLWLPWPRRRPSLIRPRRRYAAGGRCRRRRKRDDDGVAHVVSAVDTRPGQVTPRTASYERRKRTTSFRPAESICGYQTFHTTTTTTILLSIGAGAIDLAGARAPPPKNTTSEARWGTTQIYRGTLKKFRRFVCPLNFVGAPNFVMHPQNRGTGLCTQHQIRVGAYATFCFCLSGLFYGDYSRLGRVRYTPSKEPFVNCW